MTLITVIFLTLRLGIHFTAGDKIDSLFLDFKEMSDKLEEAKKTIDKQNAMITALNGEIPLFFYSFLLRKRSLFKATMGRWNSQILVN